MHRRPSKYLHYPSQTFGHFVQFRRNETGVAFRGDKNFKDILVHKKHNNVFYNKHNKCEPCGKNCALCKHIMTAINFMEQITLNTNSKAISTVNPPV